MVEFFSAIGAKNFNNLISLFPCMIMRSFESFNRVATFMIDPNSANIMKILVNISVFTEDLYPDFTWNVDSHV